MVQILRQTYVFGNLERPRARNVYRHVTSLSLDELGTADYSDEEEQALFNSVLHNPKQNEKE
jgi:hypothetical protein